MHVRQIERTELNGMILQYTQSLPEICYNGCVICFIGFDGDIQGVGTRIADLNAEEFETFKTLIGKIEFEGDDVDYAEMAKSAIEAIKLTAESLLEELGDHGNAIWSGDFGIISENLIKAELANEKLRMS